MGNMAYRVVVDPEAYLEIVDGIEWYNKAQAGLGYKFYKQIQAVFKIIRKNPFAYGIRYKSARTAVVKKFPFLIHYFIEVEAKTIVVSSVLHTSRYPKHLDGLLNEP